MSTKDQLLYVALHGTAESDVVHDHVGPGEHEIVAIARIAVRVRTRHMEHAGQTEGGETVCGRLVVRREAPAAIMTV